MNPLTLSDLSGNAFRILGLTADASQARIDAAARRMRIFAEPADIPGSANDAGWIGPVPRTRERIESAVARLADPISRLEERFWWFCLPPPALDEPPADDPTDIPAFHDAALLRLYRSLLTDAAGGNRDAWEATVKRFKALSTSDDYLQWLFDVESAGDFEKAARLEEIAEAQQRIPLRLCAAVAGDVSAALAGGDFAAAAGAVHLARAASPRAAEDLLDRMEDELAGRCNELTGKIDAAWETRRVAELRPACNHAIVRFDSVIRPLIDELLTSTADVDRQHRARMHGIKLLTHTAKAYEAFDNFLASQRALETALALAASTPMEPGMVDLLEKVKPAARRQRAGVSREHRRQPPEQRDFRVKQGGPSRDASWLEAIPLRRLVWPFVIIAMGIARLGCLDHSSSPPPHGPIPIYDSAHPPPGIGPK